MRKLYLVMILLLCVGVFNTSAQQSNVSAKRERNYIKEGNKLYNDKRYSEAEIAYRKALQENEASEVAQFNLASALLRQVSLASGQEDTNGSNPVNEAQTILQNLAVNASNQSIAEKSLYNLGNMAFNQEQYRQSIDLYKKTLRKNPDNDEARDNLRLAQLKLQEQQNQEQNQDQNRDQNQNRDQQQDQQKQQNQDRQNEDNQQDQDKNQDQQQDQQQQQQDEQQQQQEQQNGISDRNAEQILKAMENQENATRRKIEAQRQKEEQNNATKRNTDKPW